MDCLFCKIINKEIPANIVYEDDKIIGFRDINPKAPLHLLIVPKKHIPSVDHLETQDRELIGELFLTAQKIARDQGIAPSSAIMSAGGKNTLANEETGYKLVFNVGRGGGQVINHLHLHLLGGWKSEKEGGVPGIP